MPNVASATVSAKQSKNPKDSRMHTKNNFAFTIEGMERLAEKIRDDLKLVVIRGNAGRKERALYAWRNNFYNAGADQDIEHQVHEEFGASYEVYWYNKVYDKLCSNGSIDRSEFKKPKRTTNIGNGVLTYPKNVVEFIPEKEIETHFGKPYHNLNFTYKLPLIYDPKAECPRIQKIVEQILVDKNTTKVHDVNEITWIQNLSDSELQDPIKKQEMQESLDNFMQNAIDDDARMSKVYTFYEFLGLILMSEYEFKYALALLGLNHVGKGTLINIIMNFIGIMNVSSVALGALANDKFSASCLENKFVNVCEEMTNESIKSWGFFKAATSGSVFNAEAKYEPPHPFSNVAKFIMTGNDTPKIPPKIYQKTISRIVAIELLNEFNVSDQNTDSTLQHQEYTQEEMSGLLNLAIQGLNRLLKNNGKFSAYDETETPSLWNKYSRIKGESEVARFLSEYCDLTDSPSDMVSHKELFTIYKDKFNGKESEKSFAKQVVSHKEDIVNEDNGKVIGENAIETCWHNKVRTWKYLRLKDCHKYTLGVHKSEEDDLVEGT